LNKGKSGNPIRTWYEGGGGFLVLGEERLGWNREEIVVASSNRTTQRRMKAHPPLPPPLKKDRKEKALGLAVRGVHK